MEEVTSGPVFILTGAGFSKNFGGFLGSEMWGQIFNNKRVQADSDLRDALKDDYDYESVYSKVLDSNLPEGKKQIMREVMLEAYGRLDENLRAWVYNDSSAHPVNRYLLGELITKVQGAAQRPARAFMFTLNQDLFMERHWNWNSAGVPRFVKSQNDFGSQAFGANDFVQLPHEGAAAHLKKGLEDHNGIHYVKLHGSYGWKSSDGSNQLVVGTSKESLIQKEPLLQSYFELIKNVIQEGGKKVLIMGYGFRDAHINAELLKGVQEHGLEIYIITTQSPGDLRHQIEQGHYYAKGILDDGLRGYYQHSLLEIFPKNQERTTYFDEILKGLEIG